MPNFNLAPILYKRLRIQGSTLRARSEDYQAELVARFVAFRPTCVGADMSPFSGSSARLSIISPVAQATAASVPTFTRYVICGCPLLPFA